jgi:hypothetical protein
MAKNKEVFERCEKKYLLSETQYQALMRQLTDYVKADRYGVHTIGNIYYDTDDFSIIRASIEKPLYKEKLRLRCYGVPRPDSTVFLELKKKFKGIVYKRRAEMTLSQAQRYLQTGEKPAGSGQILDEIDWFLKRYRPGPKVYIAYDRLALYGKEDPELRITFDRNIRFRDNALDLAKGPWGTPLLESGQVLMEIKLCGAMPLWLAKALSELKLFPVTYSKYGVCYKRFLSRDIKTKGVIHCA